MYNNFFTRLIPDIVTSYLIGKMVGSDQFMQQLFALKGVNFIAGNIQNVADKYFPKQSEGIKTAASFLTGVAVVYYATDYLGYSTDAPFKVFLGTIAWHKYLNYHIQKEFIQMNHQLNGKIEQLQKLQRNPTPAA